MLELFVDLPPGMEAPSWLAPFEDHLTITPVGQLPTTVGTLGLTREGLVFYWQDGEPFRLESRLDMQGSALPQALGHSKSATVLDACAGFGQDTLGLSPSVELTLVEHSLPTALFLAQRLHDMPTHNQEYPSRQLLWADVMGVLSDAPVGAWDVIYLDPMFPSRSKGALPKRQMQVLSMLQSELHAQPDDLLQAALRVAGRRVVLKRRAKDPVIERPNHQLKGSKIRFDIYLC